MGFAGLWGMPYLMQVYSLSTQEAARYVMAVSVGLVIGCPVMGFVSDKLLKRRRAPYIACASAYAAAWAVICFAGGGRPSLSWMYPLCFGMGFFCAGFILSIVVAKEVNPLRLSGIAMGNNNTSGFLGSAVLQVVMGKVLDTRWDGVLLGGARVYPLHAYRTAFLVCFGVSLLGVLGSILLTETRCRASWDVRHRPCRQQQGITALRHAGLDPASRRLGLETKWIPGQVRHDERRGTRSRQTGMTFCVMR